MPFRHIEHRPHSNATKFDMRDVAVDYMSTRLFESCGIGAIIESALPPVSRAIDIRISSTYV